MLILLLSRKMRLAGATRTGGGIDLPVRAQLVFHRDFALTLLSQILSHRDVQALRQVAPKAHAAATDMQVLQAYPKFLQPQSLGYRLAYFQFCQTLCAAQAKSCRRPELAGY